MFKITKQDTASCRRLVVEGELNEQSLAELRRQWRSSSEELGGRKLVIELAGITLIKMDGEEGIRGLLREGAEFSAKELYTRHVLSQLERRACDTANHE